MLAIIPARSGSKGLPGKNTKDLCGKPMIAYTIEAALKSKAISRVVVSTDCSEIEEVAIAYGAESPFLRPKELASDESVAIETYLYTIDRLQTQESKQISEFCVLLPTCPLRVSSDIDKATELFYTKSADSVISYTLEHHPISWHRNVSSDGKIENVKNELLNRQDHQATYYPNGAIYIFNTKLIESRMYYSDKSFAYIMPREKSVDVDTAADFKYLEYLMSIK